MTANNPDDLATEIVALFDDHVSLDSEAIVTEIESLRDDYLIPLEEVRPIIVNQLQDEHGLSDEDLFETTDEFAPVEINDLESEFETAQANGQTAWVDVVAKYVQAWDPNTNAIQDVGIIADSTGQTKMTVWDGDGHPSLEEGETYRFESVVIEEYEGQLSLSSTPESDIKVADQAIEGTNSFEGVIIDLAETSGLINRCPTEDCSRVVNDGRCPEHGSVDGEFDLRIKAVLDDGFDAKTIYVGQDLTEELTGIDLATAKDKATDALDVSVVRNEMEEMLLGRYLEVEGSMIDSNVFVDSAEFQGGPDPDTVEEIKQLA